MSFRLGSLQEITDRNLSEFFMLLDKHSVTRLNARLCVSVSASACVCVCVCVLAHVVACSGHGALR